METNAENVKTSMDTQETTSHKLFTIQCATCGGPAEYDILKHSYSCSYCGNDTPIRTALEAKKGFRSLVQAKIRESDIGLKPAIAVCVKCGAQIVFPENDVIKTCSFCGNEMIRKEFTKMPEFPEFIVPFRITEDEARNLLAKWCKENASTEKAKKFQNAMKDLKGYYLPYELVRGPIDCMASRRGASLNLNCGGVLANTFVNTSSQLDNLTLDGMEPFDLDELEEFSYGFLAKQKAKVMDISAKDLANRIEEEVENSYSPIVAKTMETKEVSVDVDSTQLMTIPVLLPVYYIMRKGFYAAVNGQTGKVSVSEVSLKKLSPWWIKPLVATLLVFFASILISYILTKDFEASLGLAGMFDLVMGLIFFTAYHNAYGDDKGLKAFHDVVSTTELYERGQDKKLKLSHKKIEADPVEPMFFQDIDGKKTRVFIKFTTAGRMFKMVAAAVGAMFLPVIIAFLLNGLSFTGLDLMGSAVWLCIFVPIAIAYFVSMGRIDIYENPYVYVVDTNGKQHRIKMESNTVTVLDIIKSLSYIVPVAIFLGIVLIVNVYLILNP